MVTDHGKVTATSHGLLLFLFEKSPTCDKMEGKKKGQRNYLSEGSRLCRIKYYTTKGQDSRYRLLRGPGQNQLCRMWYATRS